MVPCPRPILEPMSVKWRGKEFFQIVLAENTYCKNLLKVLTVQLAASPMG